MGNENCTNGNNEGNQNKNKGGFNKRVKQDCWDKADQVPGKDPNQYRQDICGNEVRRDLNGKFEEKGFEFDHIIPKAKGGGHGVDNCQILQIDVNRAKRDHLGDPCNFCNANKQ